MKSRQGRPRLKSIAEVILFWGCFVILLMVAGAISSMFPMGVSRLVYGVLGTAASFLTVWIFLRFERKTFGDVGLRWERNTPIRLIVGFAIGAAIFLAVGALLLTLSGYELIRNPVAFNSLTVISYLVFIPLALMEEVAFRSWSQLKLQPELGLRVTLLVGAVAFALYHVANGWTLYRSFTGPFVWAFVFGLAAAWSRGIAVPTGIHLALNIFQHGTGMTGSGGAIWSLHIGDGTSIRQLTGIDRTTMMLQAAVLILSVLAAEFFIRRNESAHKDLS